MKVRITCGTPEIICQAEAEPGCGSWNRDGAIVFAPSLADGFFRVAASGGKPQQWLKLDESKSEPEMLFQTRPVPKSWNLYDVTPDGEHFLVNIPLEWTGAAPITVLTNWTEKPKQ